MTQKTVAHIKATREIQAVLCASASEFPIVLYAYATVEERFKLVTEIAAVQLRERKTKRADMAAIANDGANWRD